MTSHQSAAVCSPVKTLLVAGSLVALAALGACGNKYDNQTAGQKLDSAVTSAEKAATEAKAKAESSISSAGTAITNATQKAEASGSKSADSMIGTADDVAITASVAAGFAKDADLSAFKIDVDTKNGKVTLYGPAPSAAARERAATIAKSIKGVMDVDNKLVVKGS